MTESHPTDEAKMRGYGDALVVAVDEVIRLWLHDRVAELLAEPVPQGVTDAIEAVAAEAKRQLVELSHADLDLALSGPLERIRRAVLQLTPALDAAGAQRPYRDPVDVEMRPDDVFALGPMAFIDLGENVHSAGISWGAAKAYLHQQRRAQDHED